MGLDSERESTSVEREWQAQQRMTHSSSSKKPTRPLQTMAMRAPWEMAAPMTGGTLRSAQIAELPQWQGPCRGTTLVWPTFQGGCRAVEMPPAVLSLCGGVWLPVCVPVSECFFHVCITSPPVCLCVSPVSPHGSYVPLPSSTCLFFLHGVGISGSVLLACTSVFVSIFPPCCVSVSVWIAVFISVQDLCISTPCP